MATVTRILRGAFHTLTSAFPCPYKRDGSDGYAVTMRFYPRLLVRHPRQGRGSRTRREAVEAGGLGLPHPIYAPL